MVKSNFGTLGKCKTAHVENLEFGFWLHVCKKIDELEIKLMLTKISNVPDHSVAHYAFSPRFTPFDLKLPL